MRIDRARSLRATDMAARSAATAVVTARQRRKKARHCRVIRSGTPRKVHAKWLPTTCREEAHLSHLYLYLSPVASTGRSTAVRCDGQREDR